MFLLYDTKQVKAKYDFSEGQRGKFYNNPSYYFEIKGAISLRFYGHFTNRER